jgi:G-patch domain
MSRPDYEDEDYFIPLEDQRVFGAGIKRKRVPFVRASDDLQTTSAPPSNEPATSVADQYLAIVMSKKHKKDAKDAKEQGNTEIPVPSGRSASAPVSSVPLSESITADSEPRADTQIQVAAAAPADLCEVCKLPIPVVDSTKEDSNEVEAISSIATRDTPHEASIVHQVCLQHSHPPSHLDRSRHGLRYLASYGWDPDSRTGLGAEGRTGILQPIKPKVKTTTSGLGIAAEDEESIAARKNLRKQQQEQRQKLNAKQVRLGQLADKKKGEKLRELFYASDDVQRYLGDT